MNDSIWNKTLLSIKNIIDPLPFNTWFSNIEFIDIQDDKLRLCVPYLLYKTHIEQNYKEIIIDNFNNNSSFKINDIIFILKENLNEILDKEKEKEKEKTETKDDVDKYKPKKAINSNLNKNYTFDTFVVGESNKFAQGIFTPCKFIFHISLISEQLCRKTISHLPSGLLNFINRLADIMTHILIVEVDPFCCFISIGTGFL